MFGWTTKDAPVESEMGSTSENSIMPVVGMSPEYLVAGSGCTLKEIEVEIELYTVEL